MQEIRGWLEQMLALRKPDAAKDVGEAAGKPRASEAANSERRKRSIDTSKPNESHSTCNPVSRPIRRATIPNYPRGTFTGKKVRGT